MEQVPNTEPLFCKSAHVAQYSTEIEQKNAKILDTVKFPVIIRNVFSSLGERMIPE
jgi:hypothetical protein